jgi:tRNA threonylcarbamoyladenosine biosynthesis protein TsaE
VLLLTGSLGAGKSALARAIIQARLGRAEDVPSPTFTLVQTYEAPGGDLWHADLYRLTHPDEVIELGLEDAFTSAICLIEWPDRLGRLAPQDAVHVALSLKGEGREATFAFTGRPGLAEVLQSFTP